MSTKRLSLKLKDSLALGKVNMPNNTLNSQLGLQADKRHVPMELSFLIFLLLLLLLLFLFSPYILYYRPFILYYKFEDIILKILISDYKSEQMEKGKI